MSCSPWALCEVFCDLILQGQIWKGILLFAGRTIKLYDENAVGTQQWHDPLKRVLKENLLEMPLTWPRFSFFDKNNPEMHWYSQTTDLNWCIKNIFKKQYLLITIGRVNGTD